MLELLSPSRLPALGHATALLLELAEKEKNRALRTSSMLALDCLFSATRCLQSDMPSVLSDAGLECRFTVQFASDSAVNSRCAFCLAHFLPGIASGLGKVMLGEEKQGQVRVTLHVMLIVVPFSFHSTMTVWVCMHACMHVRACVVVWKVFVVSRDRGTCFVIPWVRRFSTACMQF